jgi:hypothetical protein
MRRMRALAWISAVAASLWIAEQKAVAEPPSHPLDSTTYARRLTPGTLRVTSPPHAVGSVFLYWDGTIAAPMAEQMSEAFRAFATSRRRVVVILSSGGGSVSEGEKVIALLQRIKRTHQLDTSVGQGGRCGSMCLPIYLQGQNRFGGRSSSWLFHEVTRPGANFGRLKRADESSKKLIEKYWIPAGVSREWIDRMLVEADNHDWWQTGNDLIVAKSGIITRPIENRRPRNLEIDLPVATATGAPSDAKGSPAKARPGGNAAPAEKPVGADQAK